MYLKSSVVYIKAPPNTKKLRRLPGKLGRIHKSSAIYLKAPPYTWKAPPWARSGWELLPPPGSSQKCKSILSLKCIKCIFYNMSFINANCMLFFTKVMIIIKECFTYLHICKSYTSTLSYKLYPSRNTHCKFNVYIQQSSTGMNRLPFFVATIWPPARIMSINKLFCLLVFLIVFFFLGGGSEKFAKFVKRLLKTFYL